MLWLAADLPHLPLEALPTLPAEPQVIAVVASRGARRWLVAAGDPALGPGMELGLARSLRPGLKPCDRQPGREAAALEALACAVYACGDRIHWQTLEPSRDFGLPRHTLWIEIGASLRLFGGIDAVGRAVANEIAALGHVAKLGVAPTIEAAAALARAERPAATDNLPEALARVPLSALSLPLDALDLLQDIGITDTGALLALPRAELGRRAGAATLSYLDRLLGLRADSRRGYQPPTRYLRRLDFAEDIDDNERLAFPLRRAVGEFVRYLRARATGVQQFRLELHHARRPTDERPATRIDFALSSPSRDEGLLLRVLRERLSATALPAPVHALSLHADHFAEPPVAQHDLFDTRPRTDEQIAAVIDRLVARLGEAAVWRPQLVDDHRPERAWRPAPLQGSIETTAAAHTLRPAWLLRTPRPLDRPPLLLGGIERIESGWWDGGDTRRDYFSCLLANGARGWVYEDKNSGRQYLQGLWG